MPTQITSLLWQWGGSAMGQGRRRVEGVFLLPAGFVAKLRGGALPLWPIPLLVPSLPPHFHQEQGSQIEEGLIFHPALKQLQCINQARVQLECELAQEAQGLTRKYNDQQIRLARKHEKWWPGLLKRQTLPSRSSFLRQAQLTQSSCYPGASPLQFPFATWMKHWPQLPNRKRTSQLLTLYPSQRAHRPQTSQTVQLIKRLTPPLPVPPFLDIPFTGTPQLGAHLQESLKALCRKSGTALQQHPLWAKKQADPCQSQEVEVRSNHSSTQGGEIMPKLVLEARHSS